MNSQRPIVVVALVAVVFLAVGGGLGYVFFLKPISEKNAAAAKLSSEASDLDLKLMQQRKALTRLADLRKISLSADDNTSKSEYHETLYDLVDHTGAKVTTRLLDATKGVPQLALKKPAYGRVETTIELQRTDLRSLIAFLQAYYKLNVLQQITSIEIQKGRDGATASKFTAPDGSDRRDLTVKIVSEALILDRPAKKATGGNALSAVTGFAVTQVTPRIDRDGEPLIPKLATKPRDYFAMIANDPFHGTLPPPPKPYVPPPPPDEDDFPLPPPTPPKQEIAQYIRLVGITLRPGEGTAGAEIKDVMNNFEYEVQFSTTRVQVKKYVGTAGRRQPEASSKPSELLVISDADSATARTFRVVGVDYDALLLVDTKETPQPIGGIAALVGGNAAALPPPPRLLRWALGDSLKAVTRATPEEIRRVLGGTGPIALGQGR